LSLSEEDNEESDGDSDKDDLDYVYEEESEWNLTGSNVLLRAVESICNLHVHLDVLMLAFVPVQ
jgi:hypothetical protein